MREAESVLIETEAGVDPAEAVRDALTTTELETREETPALVLAEPASSQGQRGDSPMIEAVPPPNKGKGVVVSRGCHKVRSTYERQHTSQRPSRGLLGRLIERSGEGPNS